jgi:hypothetical protein
MKFTTAWAKTAAQNVTLKIATLVLAAVSLVQLFIIVGLTTRDLPVIERGCFSRPLQTKPLNPSKNEIEAFILEALPMRFDSNGYLKEGFLSIEETLFREKEQLTLKQRQITQKIIIQDVKSDGKDVQVFADRLLSVGKVKSALPINLKIVVQQSNRTESNPYGLILSNVSAIEEKEEK